MHSKEKIFILLITTIALLALSHWVSAANIGIQWNQTKQTMDGFGAFAGRVTPMYASSDRSDVIAKLFSDDGLNLSMLRAEVVSGYSPREGYINFHADVPMSSNTSGPCFVDPNLTVDQINIQCGQLWILKQAQATNPNIKFVASTWTPPLYMKTDPTSDTGNSNSTPPLPNRLNPDYYQTFANYLAQFLADFKSKAGLSFYAISPQNEPDPTPLQSGFEGASWYPCDTAKFVSNFLKPALNGSGTKIMASENADWLLAASYLPFMLNPSLLCLPNPGHTSGVDMLAAHGYSLPRLTGSVTYASNPLPWATSLSGLPRWVTEASQTGGYNPGMSTGMKLAVSIHQFIANNNASAYIFWLGAVGTSDESLINIDKSPVELPKIYDVFGLFSRYIKPGYQRIDVTQDLLNPNLYVSAYRNSSTKDFTIIAINNGTSDLPLTLDFNGFATTAITPITTPAGLVPATADSSVRWQAAPPLSVNGSSVTTTIPMQSVITYTGKGL